ncbi:MAG: Smr/MutS family protein [Bacteroidales bacterium]|jgi:DNA-nicking Smr family endonuclease
MAKTNDTLTIDIHGLYADEAKEKLEKEIARAPAYVKIIRVIHGYNKGNILQETVRKRIRSKRIKEISPSFCNEGESIIYLF